MHSYQELEYWPPKLLQKQKSQHTLARNRKMRLALDSFVHFPLCWPHKTLQALSMMGEALLACYEGTNITGERVVNHYRMQLNDALIESWADSRFCQFVLVPDPLWAWVCSVLDR